MKMIKRGDCFSSATNHYVEVVRTLNDEGVRWLYYVEKNKNYLDAFTLEEHESKYADFKKLFGAEPYKVIGFNSRGALVM